MWSASVNYVDGLIVDRTDVAIKFKCLLRVSWCFSFISYNLFYISDYLRFFFRGLSLCVYINNHFGLVGALFRFSGGCFFSLSSRSKLNFELLRGGFGFSLC
ncbi:hypothetical protein D3C87_1670080 [compost metagenome]